MIIENASAGRTLTTKTLKADLVVAGGGLAGVCAAITAARSGVKVILVQDRPVLGGNASSEVRLWVLGATSHLGNNNRWSREGGVIDELLVENMYRNPEGNPLMFDTLLLDKVVSESNITLLLNTAIYNVIKKDADTIESLFAFCSQNQTQYSLKAPLFCDATGDGIVGFLAGAAFRMGAESSEEFGEGFAPSQEYGELLGHSIYFYTKDTGKSVKFTPPSFALSDITKIPRYRSFNSKEHGCKLWWIEFGGRMDTIYDTEEIKWELWKVVYGVWDYIKNSGNFPESETMTLEWVGTIPGKRESRRFEGDYMMRQQDVIEQRTHLDAVAFGGWSIDLHPADGVFSEKSGCNQWHSKGVYQIPYRSLYSKNIKNLFLGGRLISVSHVAFGSTRVMATTAYMGQVVGKAAKICIDKNIQPREILTQNHITELQTNLMKSGQHIPGFSLEDGTDLVKEAKISASSELVLQDLVYGQIKKEIKDSVGQMLPLEKGKVPQFNCIVEADENTELEVQLRISDKITNYTPNVTLSTKKLPLIVGLNLLNLDFDCEMPEKGYAFVILMENPKVKLHYSDKRITGILSVFNQINPAVSNYGKQTPPVNIGIDAFEFWCPQRRPQGQNIALQIENGIKSFGSENIKNGVDRPTIQPNAWVAAFEDQNPSLTLEWNTKKKIKSIQLVFDTDLDHPMESVQMGHPENIMPFCVNKFKITDENGKVIHETLHNHQAINEIKFKIEINTQKLVFEFEHPSSIVPASVFAIRCFA